jgi:hypothetical protein
VALLSVPDIVNSTPLTESWLDLVGTDINELIGRASRNQLVNGGMEVWQRGAGPFTAATAYTADRWQLVYIGGGGHAVSQETTTVDSGASSLKFVATAIGSLCYVMQDVEHWRELRGKAVAVSVRVHQSVAAGCRVELDDGIAVAGGGTSATTGSWVTLTSTLTVNASATRLRVRLTLLLAGTFYFDAAMLVVGPNATEFVPLHPQEDLARCQRYYEVLGGSVASLHHQGYQAAGTTAGATLHYKVTKGGTPTVTKNGTWNVVNCGQPVVGGAGVGSCYIEATVTALGNFQFTTNSTDDSVSVEHNF